MWDVQVQVVCLRQVPDVPDVAVERPLSTVQSSPRSRETPDVLEVPVGPGGPGSQEEGVDSDPDRTWVVGCRRVWTMGVRDGADVPCLRWVRGSTDITRTPQDTWEVGRSCYVPPSWPGSSEYFSR